MEQVFHFLVQCHGIINVMAYCIEVISGSDRFKCRIKHAKAEDKARCENAYCALLQYIKIVMNSVFYIYQSVSPSRLSWIVPAWKRTLQQNPGETIWNVKFVGIAYHSYKAITSIVLLKRNRRQHFCDKIASLNHKNGATSTRLQVSVWDGCCCWFCCNCCCCCCCS